MELHLVVIRILQRMRLAYEEVLQRSVELVGLLVIARNNDGHRDLALAWCRMVVKVDCAGLGLLVIAVEYAEDWLRLRLNRFAIVLRRRHGGTHRTGGGHYGILIADFDVLLTILNRRGRLKRCCHR